MLVRALISVRNGDRDPRAPGEEFDLDKADALALRAIGAVEIIDPEFAEERPSEEFTGAIETFDDPGLIETLTRERDEARLENERLRALADTATEEVLKLREQVEQLQARIGELESSPPAAGPQPEPDGLDEKRTAVLKAIAIAEGLALDGNETKADLIGKIRAARAAKAGE